MCKYCDNVFTGNCCDDILSAPLKMGNAVIGDVTVYITETVHHLESAFSEDSAIIKLYGEVGDIPIFNKYIQIKFCPFCGKELKPKKSTNERFNRIWD